MSKIKLNMINSPINCIMMDPNHRWRAFGNEPCSSPLNSPKYVEWVSDDSAEISIYHDYALYSSTNSKKRNYGWLLESSTIIPDLINNVISNIDLYRSKFIYIFTHDRRVCNVDPDFFKFTIPPPMSYIRRKQIYHKNKNISVIMSSTNDRHQYVYRNQCLDLIKQKEGKLISLGKDIKVDVYGRGRENELPWVFEHFGQLESGKILGLKDYRFSFAFDNNNYPTIFSDKITDCFATGTIPIWYGCPDIGDWFDKDGIIIWDEDLDIETLNEDLYFSKKNSIKNNFDIISNMISAEDYIYENYLKL
jgi:hypothetical protein